MSSDVSDLFVDVASSPPAPPPPNATFIFQLRVLARKTFHIRLQTADRRRGLSADGTPSRDVAESSAA